MITFADITASYLAERRAVGLKLEKGEAQMARVRALHGEMGCPQDALPRELVDARRIVHTRDDILAAADQEANRIIDDAEKQAATIASEQEIVRLAEQERDRVLADAQEKELDLRYGAYKYTDDVFAQLENNLNKLLDNVARCRQSLNENHQP